MSPNPPQAEWLPTSERARLRRLEARTHLIEQLLRQHSAALYELALNVRQTNELELENARSLRRIAIAVEVFSRAPVAITMQFGPSILEEPESPPNPTPNPNPTL